MSFSGHFSFPDSLGDDLIIDVSDSKGKPCGRVVAQVATMAEEPVRFPLLFCCCLESSLKKMILVDFYSLVALDISTYQLYLLFD